MIKEELQYLGCPCRKGYLEESWGRARLENATGRARTSGIRESGANLEFSKAPFLCVIRNISWSS